MANRRFNQFTYALERARVEIFAKVAIGATGAATLTAANSKGITSITRNSAGDYTLTLQDNYDHLLGFRVSFLSSTGIPAATCVGIKANGVTTGSIRFVCSTAGGGSATDPGSGETMFVHLTLSNSSVP